MSTKKYPKIDSLYTRDEKFKITDEIRRPEFLVPREWFVTEKIDGTNIRISLEREMNLDNPSGEEWVMRINGRNDNSQIPPNLLRHLQETFTLEGLKYLWRGKSDCKICGGHGHTNIAVKMVGVNGVVEDGYSKCNCYSPYPITLYGEGYGGGIQKGGHEYTSKIKGGAVSFRLFDVLVGDTWLRRLDVENVAAKLGIKTVPLWAEQALLPDIVKSVQNGIASNVAYEEGTEGHVSEGVVAFTAEPLYNNRGQRLMFKLKSEDFA